MGRDRRVAVVTTGWLNVGELYDFHANHELEVLQEPEVHLKLGVR